MKTNFTPEIEQESVEANLTQPSWWVTSSEAVDKKTYLVYAETSEDAVIMVKDRLNGTPLTLYNAHTRNHYHFRYDRINYEVICKVGE